MKTRILWLMASSITAAALLLISCGPKAAPAPTTPAPVTTPTPAAPAPVAPTPGAPAPVAPRPAVSVEKPKYGGTINVIIPNFTEKYDIAAAPG